MQGARTMKILISGAGIAGPALALALEGQGHELTIVERASALRVGGHAVDFRGPVHREALERLGLWEPIHARRTHPKELVLLDRRGREAVRLPAVMMCGDVEIVRGDLTRLLVDLTRASADYRFGDHVIAIDGGHVRFASGREEDYDLIVGADGLHSGVRAVAFGDEERFVVHHGYRLAVFGHDNVLELDRKALTWTVAGRSMMVSDTLAQLVFVGDRLGRERLDVAFMRAMIREAYRDVGWESERVLIALDRANDLYVDQIATITIDRYARDRVVLLGDAAWGGTLAGQGTPLAIIGAYVLAHELARRSSLESALARFEARMRPYATECQKGVERAGPFFAPRTSFGLACRDLFYRAMTSRLLIGQFEKLVKSSASAFELPAREPAIA